METTAAIIEALERAPNVVIPLVREVPLPLLKRRPAPDWSGSVGDPVEALVLDLLEWIGPDSRPYAEVIDAWRTSCPKLPVWEDANSRGFITLDHEAGLGTVVGVSATGRAFLRAHRTGSARTEC